MTACVLYAAKSTADEHGSISSQLASSREHAEHRGWNVVAEFHDEAASAYKGSRGPGLAGARARVAELAAEDGEAVLLVFASDRLARGDGRTATHLVEYVLEAAKNGYRIESVTEDLGGQMALVLAALYGERAHADSAAKSVHTKAGKRRAAERGRRNGGPRPFGYRHVPVVVDGRATSTLEIVPAEAGAVRRMFSAAAEGRPQAEIARELNAAGITTVRGVGWSQSRVGQTLRNPLYVGKVRHRADLFDGAHEPIVSAELWRAVEAMRMDAVRRPNRGGGRRPKGPHLLTGGLLRCSCGAAMRARTQPKQHGAWEAYLCDGRHSGRTSCAMPPLARAEVDQAVWCYFEKVALDADTMRREATERRSLEASELAERITEAEAELARATERIDRVRRDYLDGKLTADERRNFMDELESEHAAASAALERLHARAVQLDAEADTYDAEEETLAALVAIRQALTGIILGGADLGEARRALRRVFESFTVHRYGDALTETLEADLAAGDWYIVPIVRAEAILSPLVIEVDQRGDLAILQDLQVKRTYPSRGFPSASQR
jgi:site-specific DNA recombinase